ncbi:MAG: NUMOD4 domain-containing protein [Sporolactobacillus sp.]
MAEIWKDVIGYEGFYQVSNFGRVKSMDRMAKNKFGVRNKPVKGKILTLLRNYRGYIYCHFTIDGHGKHVNVHRLVCHTFNGDPPNSDAVVNHIDGNKENNIPENLEWCSNKENTGHAIKTGLWKNIGEEASSNVLTEYQVLDIRNDHTKSYTELSKMYGVSKASIADIKKFRSWKQLSGDKLIDISKIDKDKLGNEIRSIRKNKELTIEKFAATLGVSRYSVMRWESGKECPKDGLLRKIIKQYKLKISKVQ